MTRLAVAAIVAAAACGGNHAAPAPTPSQPAVICEGKTCATGESCVEYTGMAGQPLHTCAVPCNADKTCSNGKTCRSIFDGPGNICD